MSSESRDDSQDSSVSELLRIAIEHHQEGRLQQAESIYRQILKTQPNHPEALHRMGAIAQQLGKNEIAISFIREAIKADPTIPAYYVNLGCALFDLGKLDEAIASYREAISLNPDYAHAYCNLANALRNQGKLDEALAFYDKSISLNPKFADAHSNLGATFILLGRFDEALTSCGKAISLDPNCLDAYNNLGAALISNGKLNEATVCYRKALSLNPNYVIAYSNLGYVFRGMGKLDDAVACCRKAISLKPDYVDAYNNLGAALKDQSNKDEAIASYRKAIALNPNFAAGYNNLGCILTEQGKLEEAVACCQKALSLKPDYVDAYNNLGLALMSQGRLREAIASYQNALAINPDYVLVRSNLIYWGAFAHYESPESQCSFAAEWETRVLSEAERDAARKRKFPYLPLSGRKLRIGIVSAELGQHAVAEFLEPILENFDRNRIHVSLYPTMFRPESRVNRLRELADDYKSLVGLSDSKAAEQIRSDEIDILIDTTSHMSGCRLGIFAHRAAPVQCHYIGHCGTTGLSEMDWFIADNNLLPPSCDSHFREGIWRLPRLWLSYRGDASLPNTQWKPDHDGTIWLGTFNNLAKVREETCALWAKVMQALPESKLLLKDRAATDPTVQRRITVELEHHGIDSKRIEFAAWTPDWVSHMTLYDRLDIALDTVPFNSGTTAFDALWMGVPMIALEGDWMGGRMTATILNALQKPDWIAHTEDEYVSRIVGLAHDVEGRRKLRAEQRNLMANSQLCDAKGLAHSLEDAFAAMFNKAFDSKD